MVPALLIMVREGFEAALVVAIVFAYLRRIGRLDLGRSAWVGVAAATACSLAIGVVVRLSVGNLVGAARMRAFASVSLAAVIVLTWMVFWMRRQARAIKGELEQKVDTALGSDNPKRAVMLVTFMAVIREGIEAALFLLAASTSAGGGQVVLGGLIGLSMATVLGVIVYVGGRKLPMRLFFRVTGMIIVVFAAGLMARTVLFLQNAGDLGSVADNVYDLTGVSWLTFRTESGKMLAALFGWDPRPSLEQVVAWAGYIVPVTYLFLHEPRTPAPVVADTARETSAAV